MSTSSIATTHIWDPEFIEKLWWSPLVFAQQSCFHNARLLYRKCHPGVTYLQFQSMCCAALLLRFDTMSLQDHMRQGRSSNLALWASYDRQDHWIIDQKSRQTRYIYRYMTRYIATRKASQGVKCDIGMHVHCFKDYHTFMTRDIFDKTITVSCLIWVQGPLKCNNCLIWHKILTFGLNEFCEVDCNTPINLLLISAN